MTETCWQKNDRRRNPRLVHKAPKGRIPASILPPSCLRPAFALPSPCPHSACVLPASCPAERAETQKKGRKTGKTSRVQTAKNNIDHTLHQRPSPPPRFGKARGATCLHRPGRAGKRVPCVGVRLCRRAGRSREADPHPTPPSGRGHSAADGNQGYTATWRRQTRPDLRRIRDYWLPNRAIRLGREKRRTETAPKRDILCHRRGFAAENAGSGRPPQSAN